MATGLAVGVLTSFGQGHLNGTLDPLVNSASAWLVAPFLVGSRMTSRRDAAVAGLIVCLLQLVGYSAAAELRGFAAGGAIVVFWSACAFVGGPIFGAAGRLWRVRADPLHRLGSAILPAAFLAEGLWVYAHELHYRGAAALWITIGVLLTLTMIRGVHGSLWLALALTAGLIGEIALTQVYAQSF